MKDLKAHEPVPLHFYKTVVVDRVQYEAGKPGKVLACRVSELVESGVAGMTPEPPKAAEPEQGETETSTPPQAAEIKENLENA